MTTSWETKFAKPYSPGNVPSGHYVSFQTGRFSSAARIMLADVVHIICNGS